MTDLLGNKLIAGDWVTYVDPDNHWIRVGVVNKTDQLSGYLHLVGFRSKRQITVRVHYTDCVKLHKDHYNEEIRGIISGK